MKGILCTSMFRIAPLKLCLWICFSLCSVAVYSQVSGTVVDESSGEPLIGATVLIQGTATGTVTDFDGTFTVNANPGDVLVISFTGYNTKTIEVESETTLNVMLAQGILIDEVVVTGYSSQRKQDITGAVSVVNAEQLNEIQAVSFTQKLEGQASGVSISTSGEPGEGTNVRIRGISSFQNNDPLYIIDGVPVTDRYGTTLNPNDIESIQVLKDAASASIYGARANNGVIIVTTKKGTAGKTKVTYNGYVGAASAAHKMDYLVTDPIDFSNYAWDRYENGGLDIDAANPYSVGRGVLPNYIFPFPASNVNEADYSFPDNIIIPANKEGTNWFDEVFRTALVHEHNIGISGGSENANYYFSGSYLDQDGTMVYNWFKRFSLRANTEFKLGRFTFGENFTVARTNNVGQDSYSGGNQDEQGIMTQLTMINPLVPVHDAGGVYWGGAKASGIGGGNPVASNFRNKDNENTSYRVLGNAYAQVDLMEGLQFKTSFGINYNNNYSQGFNFPVWEARQPNTVNGFSENWQNNYNWTWTNTLTWNHTFAEKHDLQILVGYEAIKNRFRQINGGINNYFTEDINAWYVNGGLADPETRSVNSFGNFSSLASSFAKVDYVFNNKYILSGTIRRDGSSNFGQKEQYGVFPAFSVGWRISEESFLQNVSWLDDLKLRYGWGITGNQNIPGGNTFDRFGGGTGSTFYDINGTNNSIVTGYALTNRGNANTKWEENISSNFGIDLSAFNGSVNLVVDIYKRTVDGLLFQAPLPGTSGTSSPAYTNIASMENRGVDLGLEYRNRVNNNFSYNAGITFTQYSNEIIDIDGSVETWFPTGFDSRIGTVNINQVGESISSFFGYQADGYFQSQAEVDAHAAQDGAAPGRIRFKDLDSDGVINDNDKGVIGNPHPDFTLGFRFGFNLKNFDFSTFLYASIGNELFNYQKLFDVFSFFNSNVRKDVVTDSWTPSNPDAKYPINDINDIYSISPNTFYIEDASYLRAKTVQLGYTFSQSTLGNVFSNLRIYLQAQNLFTITDYSGLDPTPSNFDPSNGLNGDLWNGYDTGNYPTSRIFSFGVSAGF